MGFLDFLKGGKAGEAEPASQAKDLGSVELAVLRETVMQSISDEISREKEKSKELYEKMREEFARIRKLNSELTRKSFKSGQRLDAPVNMIKDNYAKKSLSMLNNIPVINTFGYPEITDFCSWTDRTLKDMQNIPPKQAVLLSRYFKGEASKIIKTLKNIGGRRKEMEAVLSGKALWMENEISSGVDNVLGLVKRAEELEDQEITLRDRIKKKKSGIKETEADLKAFVSGKEYAEFGNIGKEMEELGKEKLSKENEIREELAAVKRPLKKLEYSARQDRGISREKLSLFSKVSKSPMKVLLEQGDSPIKEALVGLRDLMLKDNEKERVEELITKIGNGYLSRLVDRYKWAEVQIADKREKESKSDVPERKGSMERGLENLRREISEYEREMEKVLKNREDAMGDITKETESLEALILKELNLKLNITL